MYSCRGLAFMKEHVVSRTRRGHDARVDKYDKLHVIVCVCESLSGRDENADETVLKVHFIRVKYTKHLKGGNARRREKSRCI